MNKTDILKEPVTGKEKVLGNQSILDVLNLLCFFVQPTIDGKYNIVVPGYTIAKTEYDFPGGSFFLPRILQQHMDLPKLFAAGRFLEFMIAQSIFNKARIQTSLLPLPLFKQVFPFLVGTFIADLPIRFLDLCPIRSVQSVGAAAQLKGIPSNTVAVPDQPNSAGSDICVSISTDLGSETGNDKIFLALACKNLQSDSSTGFTVIQDEIKKCLSLPRDEGIQQHIILILASTKLSQEISNAIPTTSQCFGEGRWCKNDSG